MSAYSRATDFIEGITCDENARQKKAELERVIDNLLEQWRDEYPRLEGRYDARSKTATLLAFTRHGCPPLAMTVRESKSGGHQTYFDTGAGYMLQYDGHDFSIASAYEDEFGESGWCGEGLAHIELEAVGDGLRFEIPVPMGRHPQADGDVLVFEWGEDGLWIK